MLKRIAIDNFRCFEKFEFRPQSLQLLLGRNGSGKSSFLDALTRLRQVIYQSRPITEAFNSATRTRWSSQLQQSFELEVSGNDGSYSYRLVLQHNEYGLGVGIIDELLAFNGTPLVQFTPKGVDVTSDAGKTVRYGINNQQSSLTVIPSGAQWKRLAWFRDWIGGLYCLRVNPARMSSTTARAINHPSFDFSDFVSWYMHLVLEQSNETVRLRDSLRTVVPNFDSMVLRDSGKQRIMTVLLSRDDAVGAPDLAEYDFEELSDGQRALISLYTVLACAMSKGRLVLFDEPDNYISLAEIQPWLLALTDKVEMGGAQAIIVSHHPELLNQLAPQHGILFRRENGAAVRIEDYKPSSPGLLTPAEEIARGWERG